MFQWYDSIHLKILFGMSSEISNLNYLKEKFNIECQPFVLFFEGLYTLQSLSIATKTESRNL